MCLNPLDGSSLADARASDSASAMRCPSLSPELTPLNGRWISQLRWVQIRPGETAVRDHKSAEFLSRVHAKWNHGGQIEQTTRKRAGPVVCGYKLRLVPSLSRRSAKSHHL